MAWTSTLAIYFILWWVTLFAVLPWGNRSAHEEGVEVEVGHASSAPLKPNILLKFLATTVISAIIFAIGYWVAGTGLVTLEDFPLMRDLGRSR